jgi:hypothetical protein
MKLVEKVKKRVIRRLREDAEQDRLFRQQAIDVYEGLLNYLRSGGELKDFGRAVTIDQFMDLEERAADPLIIRFDEKRGPITAAYREGRGEKEIVMYVLEKDIYDDISDARRDMVRGLQDNAKAFIHEYIHYLDDRRTELGLEDLASYDTEGGNKAMSVYFSDPIEVNAFFQSGLAQLESTLEVPGVLDSYMKKDWNKNFRDFKDWFFDEHIPPQMQFNIDDGQEKRLINRLYGFWQNIKDRYENSI